MANTLTSFDFFLKEIYRPELIERLVFQTEQLRMAVAQCTPLEIGIAATAAVSGLAWMIHRRNIVANDPNESLVKAFTEWCLALLNGLFARPKALPAHTEMAHA